MISVSLIFLPSASEENAITNATIIATAVMAAGAGMLVLFRSSNPMQKRLHIFMIAALFLWLAAESVWTYYETGLGIENPYPSAADGLWLAGYMPFIIYMSRVYRSLGSKVTEHRLIGISLTTIIMSMIIAIFLLPIARSTLSGGNDLFTLAVSMAYPTLDAVLLSIAILTIVSIRPSNNGYLFVPSILITVGIIAFVIADTGFGYSAVADPEMLEMQDEVWNSLYALNYLCLAGALYWYYRMSPRPVP